MPVLLVFAVVTFGETKNIGGRWTAPFDREGTPVTIVMNLALSGEQVTGTITHARGDVMKIRNGKLEGTKLGFDATDEDGDTYQYTGEAGDDLIRLRIEYNGTADGPLLTFRRSEK